MNPDFSLNDVNRGNQIFMHDIEELEEADLRLRYGRGDYIDPEVVKLVKQLLREFEKERNLKEACEKASFSAALTANKRARTSTAIALTALVISFASLLWQIYGHGR